MAKKREDYLDLITKIGLDNMRLLDNCKRQGLKKLILVALGNSISAGLSLGDENVPLLDRNTLLEVMCDEYNIDLYKYKFARTKNNSDESVFEWITNNNTEKDMNDMNRKDYRNTLLNGKRVMSEKDLKETYVDREESDVSIQDILYHTEEDTANISIYNGCTGSFIENLKDGKTHKSTDAINKDLAYIESIFGLIQNANRKNESEMHVYLCGVPNIYNLGMNNKLVNRKLKNISARYAHSTFVDNTINANYNAIINNIDCDKYQYLLLTRAILNSVIKNYEKRSLLIDLDRDLYKLNNKLEKLNFTRNTYDEVLSVIGEYAFMYSQDDDYAFLNMARDYILERHSYDFSKLDKKAIKDAPDLLLRP